MTLEQVLALRAKSDPRGWVRCWLGKRHPWAGRSGYQWRHRLVAMAMLGRKLRTDEHVHHLNGQRDDDRPENLVVVLAEYHGAMHCAFTDLSGHEGERLVELEQPGPTFRGYRDRAVLSERPIP